MRYEQNKTNKLRTKIYIMSEHIDKQRTESQNNAMWLFMTQLAESLNNAGKDMRIVLKPTYSIPWTKDSVHDHLWIPLQKAMYGTDSTKFLHKIEQVDRIHEVIMREMGEKHQIEYIPWPNDPDPSPLKNKKYG